MVRIAVDAMGGDHAPAAIVDGAVAAARHLDIQVSLVGAHAAVEQALDAHPDWRSLPVTVVDAPDVIEMADAPAAVRRKPRASIRVAAGLVARREADALFSAGHTGATVVATHAAFGMIAGVDRPALATTIPTRGRPAVLLDAGANVECRPQHLLQSAIMGGVYARIALGAAKPRIGLLSEYGGAPLLGVAGLAIVGHGRSSPKAVRNAIAVASRFAAGDFIQRLEREIAAVTVPHQ